MGCEEAVYAAECVPGFSGTEYLTMLYNAALDTDVEGDALEIGCFMGRSTAAIAQALKDRKLNERLTIIDRFMAPEEDPKLKALLDGIYKPKEKFLRNMEASGIDNFDLIEADSHDDKTWEKVPAKIRFAHIDGDHSYEGVKNDIERTLARVSNGAVIAIDDYHNRNWDWGIVRAVKELLMPRCIRRWLSSSGEHLFVEVSA